MDCGEFGAMLHLLGDPSSPEDLHQAALAHGASCQRCRRLYEIAYGDSEHPDDAHDGLLTASILDHTSGAPCDRLDARICAWADGDLPDTDEALLLEHLDRCPACRAAASTLAELRDLLPELAEVQPDAYFVRDVLDRTTRADSDRHALLAHLGRAWADLVQRPRIAQEIAYVGAMLLLLFRVAHVGLAPPTTKGRQPISAETARNVTAGLNDGAEALARLGVWIGGTFEDLARLPAAGGLHSRVDGAMTTWNRLQASWQWIVHDVCRAAAALVRLDSVEMWRAFEECRDRLTNCWASRGWSEPSSTPVRQPVQTDRRREPGHTEEGSSDEHGSRSDGSE